ncbi:MAG: choice-of-anchor tandem repeat GloVer-containing protein, partial [Candidatus Cybelea sp.]
MSFCQQCTSNGGKYGYGTVFSITTAGTEKVLHSFGTGSDGRAPIDGLIELKGNLYGTTRAGGAHTCGSGRGQYAGCGTVFSITPEGAEKVLHSFNSTDGANPAAALIDAGGTFYGTTAHGGANGDGTVFSITLGGREKVLRSFTGYPNDGAAPMAPLIDLGAVRCTVRLPTAVRRWDRLRAEGVAALARRKLC